MPRGRRDRVVIQQGITGNGSGLISNLVVQKNGIIRIKPDSYNKAPYSRRLYPPAVGVLIILVMVISFCTLTYQQMHHPQYY